MSVSHANTSDGPPMAPGDLWFTVCTAIALAGALAFGGATGKWFPSDAVPMLLGGPLLIWAILRLRKANIDWMARTALVLFACAAILQGLHLVPLPPGVWTSLPGREALAEVLAAAGLELNWAPFSIAPWATFFGLAAFAVPAAVFAAGLTVPHRALPALLWLILAAAAVNVFLGTAQVAEGAASSLRFFEFTNVFQPVGIFANANHLACFLAIAIPFAAAAAVDRDNPPGLRWLAAGSAVLSLAGLATTFSRAGILLAVIACVASGLAVLAARRAQERFSFLLMLGLGLAVLAIVIQLGLVGLVRRAEHGGPLDSRLVMAEGATAAASAFAPLGAGLGTARTAYAMMEPADRTQQSVVNQVHNEYVQLWLEAGVPGALLGAAALVFFIWSAGGRLRQAPTLPVIGPAACLTIIAVHSLVDYPLRTLAIQAVLAFSLALLLRREHQDRSAKTRRRFSDSDRGSRGGNAMRLR